jgi:hypothetical protein
MADLGWATVRVKRLFTSNKGLWTVWVDGQEAALLGDGDDCELRIWPGTHRIEAGIEPKAMKGTVDLVLTAGELVELECHRKPVVRLRPVIELRQRPSSTQVFGQPPETS